MTDPLYAYTTLILAPLCVGLIIVFFYQLKEVRSASEERKSALNELAEERKKTEELREQHRIEIEALKIHHQDEIKGKEKEIAKKDARYKAAVFLMERPDVAEHYRNLAENEYPPGADPGN